MLEKISKHRKIDFKKFLRSEKWHSNFVNGKNVNKNNKFYGYVKKFFLKIILDVRMSAKNLSVAKWMEKFIYGGKFILKKIVMSD